MKRLHCFLHESFEDIGVIRDWAAGRSVPLSFTRFYQQESLPSLDSFDGLIVMGGPMGVYDEITYPWLKSEKHFLKEVIATDKFVLGICLGAQLLADAIGAKVYRNAEKEIGWWPIHVHDAARSYFPASPAELFVFQWHGDTFDIPAGAIPLAESSACNNQGFVFADRVYALQFHLEVTSTEVQRLIQACRHELVKAPYIQSETHLLEFTIRYSQITRQVLFDFLDQRFL